MSDVLQSLLLWLPNVVVALVVLVIGGLAACALSNLVRGATAEAGIQSSGVLAKLAATLVWTFAIVVAVNQIGIATTLVNTLFMAFRRHRARPGPGLLLGRARDRWPHRKSDV